MLGLCPTNHIIEWTRWAEGNGRNSSRGMKQAILSYYTTNTSLKPIVRMTSRFKDKIGNIEDFLESLTMASACNKVLRRKFLNPNTIGLIPTGG